MTDIIQPKVSFSVYTRSRASLAAVGAGVGKALGCAFAPYEDQQYDRGEAMAASVLGLRLTVSHDPDVPEGEERLYVLDGWIRDDLDADWDADAPLVDISGFVVGVLALADPDVGWRRDESRGADSSDDEPVSPD